MSLKSCWICERIIYSGQAQGAMIEIANFGGLGRIVAVPQESTCRDGRGIPLGVAYDQFAQLSVFEWTNGATYPERVFVYNPFLVHPIHTRSIVDSIDPDGTRFLRKHHKGATHFLRRRFDCLDLRLDPVFISQPGIVLIDNELPDTPLYFQCNAPHLGPPLLGLIETEPQALHTLLSELGHEVYQGPVEQKGTYS